MRKSRVAPVLVVLIISAFTIKMIARRGSWSGERTEIPGLFVRYHSISAGEIAGTNPYQTLVELINRGPTVLRVETARPDCACTTVRGGAQIPPNGRVVAIPVIVDINALPSGKFHKSILFKISDGRGRDGSFIFQVGGTVDRSAVLSTLDPILDFGTIVNPGGRNQLEKMLYLSGPAATVRGAPPVIDFDAPSDRTIELSTSDPPGAQLFQTIRVRLHLGARWRPGPFHFTLSFHSLDASAGVLNIPVSGDIRYGITASPERLLVPEEPATCVSVVRLPPGLRMKDISIVVRGPITYDTHEIRAGTQDGTSFRLTVHRARSIDAHDSEEGKVTIKSAVGGLSLEISAILLPPQRPLLSIAGDIPISFH